MSARYSVRHDADGDWSVIDAVTAETVQLNGLPQTGLMLDDADDLADLLNTLEREVYRGSVTALSSVAPPDWRRFLR